MNPIGEGTEKTRKETRIFAISKKQFNEETNSRRQLENESYPY